jgi:hypothetical protein
MNAAERAALFEYVFDGRRVEVDERRAARAAERKRSHLRPCAFDNVINQPFAAEQRGFLSAASKALRHSAREDQSGDIVAGDHSAPPVAIAP